MDVIVSSEQKFVAPVIYVQPDFEALKRQFPDYINPEFKGLKFEPIDRCKEVSRENREVAFEYVHMNRYATTDEVLAEMDRKELRPALYEEFLGFDAKYPDELEKHSIVALGSVALFDGHRLVAYLWGDSFGRGLSLNWIDIRPDWYDGFYWFLAVRK